MFFSKYILYTPYFLLVSLVEWDAVELPSQFMENWCYDTKTLYGFAKHYQTNQPLPTELFEKIKAAKNFQAGFDLNICTYTHIYKVIYFKLI